MTKNLYELYSQATSEPKADLYSLYENAVEDKTSALKTAIYESTPIPPEAATKQYQLSRQTSLPVNVVRAKENEIKKMTEIQSFDYEDLVNNFPQTALQLSDPNKTGAIKDDVDSLTYFEKIVKNTQQEFKSNLAGAQTTDLRLRKMRADLMGEQLSNKEENELALYYQGREGQVDYELGLFKNKPTEILAKTPGYTIGQIPNIIQTLGYAAPAAAGGFAIAGPAGATTAGTAGAFLGSAKRMTADAYDEFKNFTDENGNKIEPKVAAGAAFLSGGVGGALELLPIGQAAKSFKGLFTKESAETLLKTSAGRETLKNIAGMALVEGATEASQEFSNVVFGEAAKLTSEKEFKPFGVRREKVTPEAVAKYLTSEPILERVKEAGVGGAIGGAGFGTFSSGINYATQRYQARQKQERDKKIIEDVVQKTSESKIYQRDPELFREVTKDTIGSQNVYFPAEEIATYFQDKPQQLQALYSISPAAREQLDEAAKIGGNIIIPGNQAADILVREPELKKYASLSPEGYIESLLQEKIADDSIRIQSLVEENQQTRKELNQVQKNIESKILNLGMPYRDARDVISLVNSFYETQRQKLGSQEAQKVLDSYLGQFEAKREIAPAQTKFSKIEDLDLLLDKVRKQSKTKNTKPLLKLLREQGGVRIGSNLAGELNNVGINPKTAPALFKKKGGIGDVDNFPLSEIQERFPNIQLPADETGNYVDRQALLDLIAEEQSGKDISRVESETEQFVKQLEEAGIDLKLSNEEIKKAIKELEGQTFNQGYFSKLFVESPILKSIKEKYPNVNIYLTEGSDGIIILSKIIVPKEDRNKGIGTSILKDIIEYANQTGQKIELSPSSDFGGSVARLKKLYKSLGFVENKGKNKDYSTRETFFKLPEAQAQDQTQTPAFKKWFGNSKVVDENGKPLVVYHGTSADFAEFDMDKSGSNWREGKGAFFFSGSANVASNYAIRGAGGANVIPAYLTIKNPYTNVALDPINFYDYSIKPERNSLQARGYDGVIVKSVEGRRDLYVAFEPTQIKSAIGNQGTFDPENPNILYQGKEAPRGQTQFLGQKPIITLFEKADRSTLLHELGHVFLQIQSDIAKVSQNEQVQKDWDVIKDWLGVKDQITTEAHEKFARGFEAYLREGKAPSVGLRDAFRRFKNWLLRIYQDVMQLNVKLNDDVRDVFDRMFATKEAIDAQKNNPLYRIDDDVMELLTKAEKEDYLKITQNAGAKAEEELLVKALKQKTVENKEFYKNELKQVKKEIQEELDKDKTYRTLTFLKTGKLLGVQGEATPLKLSREDVKNNYDGEFLKYLPKEIFGKDGVEASLIADEFGFKSGSEMLYALANAPDYKKEVSRLAKEEMLRRYGDMLYDGTIEQEAIEASQNEARANKILYELNAANRKANSLKESKEAYKQKAKEILDKKQLKDIDVNSYYLAEIKAAKEAGKYLAKKDYKKAVEAKKKQLINHYLFREATLLKREIQSSLKRYAKYKKKPVKGKVRIEEDFREKIVELLQDFGLARRTESYQQTNIQKLETWKKEKQAEGVFGLVEFPEIADFQGKSFNQLTTNEFRTLDDAIENLAHIGESQRFIEVNGKKVELDSIATKIDESIRSHLKPKQIIRGSRTSLEKLSESFDQFVMPLIKAKAIVKELDGKDRGTFFKSFIDPVANAEFVRNDKTKEVVQKFNSLLEKYFPKGFSKKRQYFASVNAEYNKESIIAFALNWGTETNRKRIRDGFNYSDAQIMDLFSTLTKNDLEFVQEMWDFIGSYWEGISSLQKKLLGFAPRKEKSSPVKIVTSDGQEINLKGGYYPLSYTEESNLKSDSPVQFGTVNSRMEFEKSYTKERTEKKVNKEVVLTLIPAIEHLANVVNDLAMKEAAWTSGKILNHYKVKKAIIDTEGTQSFKQLKYWLEDLFGSATTSASTFGKAINYLRVGTTIANMGLKVGTTIMQISGYPQSIVKIGLKPMAKGFLKFIGNGNPMEINRNFQEAMSKSNVLRSRATSFHQDIYDTLKIMEDKGKIARNSTAIYFYPMAKMQIMVDIPTWWGAYYKGLDKFKDDAQAVKYADQMVVQAQGSGLMQDLSAFERGSVGGLRKSNVIKIFTAFYTYMNAKLNLAYESYRGTDFKKPRDVAKFASDMILLYFVEAFLGQLLVRKVPDFEDDEESATLYAASLMAQNFFGQFPIAREAVSTAQGFSGTPAGLTGIASVATGISYAGKEFTEEDPDITKIIEGLNQAGGVLFHYPSGQIDVFIDASQKAQEGEDVAPIDYLIRPKK